VKIVAIKQIEKPNYTRNVENSLENFVTADVYRLLETTPEELREHAAKMEGGYFAHDAAGFRWRDFSDNTKDATYRAKRGSGPDSPKVCHGMPSIFRVLTSEKFRKETGLIGRWLKQPSGDDNQTGSIVLAKYVPTGRNNPRAKRSSN
jgi:hypothetical protein